MKHRSLLIIGTMLLAACSPTNPHQVGHDGMMGATGPSQVGSNRGMMQDSFLPARNKDINQLPEAKPMSMLEVKNGDTITLNPETVRATINGKSFALYAYNGQFPGPTLKVQQGSTFTVNVTNNIDVPTTIHWHGIRLENKFDGAAGVTQEPIEPGESFTYTVTVPDEGIFWYHPHVREDLQQDMGLYGLLHVTPRDPAAYSPVDREEYVILDDILLEGGLPVPFGAEEADYALMGRFGNTMLVNGKEPQPVEVGLGSIIRFAFLNASNTRTFRITAPADSIVKIVGGDAGRQEREYMTDSFTLSPSERVIADVYFWDDGVSRSDAGTRTVPIVESGPLSKGAAVLSATIVGGVVGEDRSGTFRQLRRNDIIAADIAALRPYFDKPIDKTIHLSVASMPARMMDSTSSPQVQKGNPGGMQHGGGHGSTSSPQAGGSAQTPESGDGIEWPAMSGVEWEDPMPQVNAMSVKHNTKWKLIDEASAAENMDIAYEFHVGDKVKIRLVNDKEADGSDHPMQHPIHFHGQRFLVLAVNGKPNENLVWKDTVLVPKDATVDILLDVTNPGDWMMHCHIAEHLSNGMMGMFTVSESR